MPLTDKSVRALKPRERPYKKNDGKGLYLIVRPDGAKWWRFRYQWRGREKLLSLGTYPTVTLARAREKREVQVRLLDRNKDPAIVRKAEKEARRDSFAGAADAWLARQTWADNTCTRNTRIVGYLKRELGARALMDIDSRTMLDALQAIEKHSPEAASRARRMASLIYQEAILAHRAQSDPAHGLAKSLASRTVTNRAAIKEARAFGQLVRAIDAYGGQPAIRDCLRLLVETFVRPSEASNAIWDEFDLKNLQWIIPAERTKQRREHTVPLSRQILQVLNELHELTGDQHFLFPGLRPGRSVTNNGLNMALRAMGYQGNVHTAHGFRASAATLLHEKGADPAVIEAQLGHTRPGVAGIYNRSTLLPQRRELMQLWSDYLDELRDVT